MVPSPNPGILMAPEHLPPHHWSTVGGSISAQCAPNQHQQLPQYNTVGQSNFKSPSPLTSAVQMAALSLSWLASAAAAMKHGGPVKCQLPTPPSPLQCSWQLCLNALQLSESHLPVLTHMAHLDQHCRQAVEGRHMSRRDSAVIVVAMQCNALVGTQNITRHANTAMAEHKAGPGWDCIQCTS
jgi:hypothetical protein